MTDLDEQIFAATLAWYAVKNDTRSPSPTADPTPYIAAIVRAILAAKDADVQELEAWRAMMLAATTSGIPGNPLSLWPNSWPQNVAIVAYALHMERKYAVRYRWLADQACELEPGKWVLQDLFVNGESFCAAIDAALAGEGEGDG